MIQRWHSPKKVHHQEKYDIKLELDVRCQKLIENILTGHDPSIGILGEEDAHTALPTDLRWVIDPIDGTVNYSYGIPHACVSIALQCRSELLLKRSKIKPNSSKPAESLANSTASNEYTTLLGVVFDPFCEEMWTGTIGGKAKLNGRTIHVSDRKTLDESIVSIGFAKSEESLKQALPYFNALAPKVRKIRIMGAAALALTYVAQARFDAYVEGGVRLWDIAAGGLIVECAGGEFHRECLDSKNHVYRLVASNGNIRTELELLGTLPGRKKSAKGSSRT